MCAKSANIASKHPVGRPRTTSYGSYQIAFAATVFSRSLWVRALACGIALGFPGQAFADDAANSENPSAAVQAASFATLDSAQLFKMLENKDFILVNVHIPYEGEIQETDSHIAFDKIADNLNKLPSDRNAEIVLYCQSGRMSEIAAAELGSLGYHHVSHLSGGMLAWKEAGHAIVEK